MRDSVIEKVSQALVKAGSGFTPGLQSLYEEKIPLETQAHAKWALETMYENSQVSGRRCGPLCDDTGIPHLILDVGPKQIVSGELLEEIRLGVELGLRTLPGRPMGVLGNDKERLDQSKGISEDPAFVACAPLQIRQIQEDVLRLHVLLFGGGPAIRGKTYRVFHKHSVQVVLDEIVDWAVESTKLLGCTPTTLTIGIGRSHYEASSLMVQSMVDGDYAVQSEMEKYITMEVNKKGCGALGLGGDTTVLATFLKVGPQRSSGVRIVSLRPSCCIEPRLATIDL